MQNLRLGSLGSELRFCCVFSSSPEAACRRLWKATLALCGRSTVSRSSPWSRPWWGRRRAPSALFTPCRDLASMFPLPGNKTAWKTKRKLLFVSFCCQQQLRGENESQVQSLAIRKKHTTPQQPQGLFGCFLVFELCFPSSVFSPILPCCLKTLK